MRLVRIAGVDLRLFDFDYDLTWYAFLMNADGKIYGRYGGRDASDAEARMSLGGLRYAMSQALAAHRRLPRAAAALPPGPPVQVEKLPAASRLRGNECIHCHQVNEFRRADLKQAELWNPEDRWVYPLPENVGLTLEVDIGNRVAQVAPGSPADRVGLKPGDLVVTLNNYPVASFADAQYALHRAPRVGNISISWQHQGKEHHAELALAEGWRKTNLTWRPSLLDILPSLTLYGTDLTAAEKKALGLEADRLAFRQQDPVHRDMRKVGVQANDVIVGINDQKMRMTLEDFLGHVRQSYLVGDRITLNVLREGERLDLPLILR